MRETAFLRRFHANRLIYQDRLGTNAGKVEREKAAFVRRLFYDTERARGGTKPEWEKGGPRCEKRHFFAIYI